MRTLATSGITVLWQLVVVCSSAPPAAIIARILMNRAMHEPLAFKKSDVSNLVAPQPHSTSRCFDLTWSPAGTDKYQVPGLVMLPVPVVLGASPLPVPASEPGAPIMGPPVAGKGVPPQKPGMVQVGSFE